MTTAGDEREPPAQAVSEFARTLARVRALDDTCAHLARHVSALVGAAGAGVSVLESGHLRSVAASDARAAALQRVQESVQAGPCMDACRSGTVVALATLTVTAPGWARYRQTARGAGIAAVASVPLCHDGVGIGAVGMYSSVAREWAADDLAGAGVLADMATSYLVHTRERDRQARIIEQLQEALDSRIVIEQAKGVLAGERHISVDEAFGVLRRHARSHAVSLRSVAEAVVSLGLRP